MIRFVRSSTATAVVARDGEITMAEEAARSRLGRGLAARIGDVGEETAVVERARERKFGRVAHHPGNVSPGARGIPEGRQPHQGRPCRADAANVGVADAVKHNIVRRQRHFGIIIFGDQNMRFKDVVIEE